MQNCFLIITFYFLVDLVSLIVVLAMVHMAPYFVHLYKDKMMNLLCVVTTDMFVARQYRVAP